MLLILPYPPSINHYWRNIGPRTIISREGRAYRKRVAAILRGNTERFSADVRLSIVIAAFPPDRRRRDLDNIQKPALDALQHAGVYEDDSQIDELITRRREVVPRGKLIVSIWQTDCFHYYHSDFCD